MCMVLEDDCQGDLLAYLRMFKVVSYVTTIYLNLIIITRTQILVLAPEITKKSTNGRIW